MSIAFPAALLGAADTAAFIATRRSLFRENPGRAGGSVALLGLWLAGAGAARAEHPGRPAKALVAALGAANAALLGAHVKAGIASPRIYVSAALATVVAVDVLRRS